MQTVEKLLRLMADGEVHSGESLGEAMGVSRTAVWKQRKKLTDLGLSLNTVKGRGYQIPGGLELLEEGRIRAALNAASPHLQTLDLRSSVSSTNAVALEQAESGQSGYVCLAEHQSAGRGRLGRPWVSPYGRNIYLSIAWQYSGGAAVLEGLSLAVGVAIVRALQAEGIRGAELKWPNDILWEKQKLAGVLLEMAGDASGVCQVVIGIGLNVAMAPEEAQGIDQRWVGLMNVAESPVSRNALVARLLNEIMPLLASYPEKGFAAYREEWESLSAFQDQSIVIRTPAGAVEGRMAGVDDTGALRLVTEEGEQLIYGGEASLRSS